MIIQGVNYADNSTKMGSKGIKFYSIGEIINDKFLIFIFLGLPHHLQLELDQFKGALYGQQTHNVTIHGLRLNADKQMFKVKLKKKGLTQLFKKFSVADDGVTCSPLMINNQFI